MNTDNEIALHELETIERHLNTEAQETDASDDFAVASASGFAVASASGFAVASASGFAVA
jgi:hypothetical protein